MFFDARIPSIKTQRDLPLAKQLDPTDTPQVPPNNDHDDMAGLKSEVQIMAKQAGFELACCGIGLLCGGPVGEIVGAAIGLGWEFTHEPPIASSIGSMWFYGPA